MTTDDAIRRDLTGTVAAVLAEADAPGAAVALVADGRPVLVTGVGHRDVQRTVALDLDARFYVYRITKLFLAVAALRLAEQGRLDLGLAIAFAMATAYGDRTGARTPSASPAAG